VRNIFQTKKAEVKKREQKESLGVNVRDKKGTQIGDANRYREEEKN
jgi:hypothetical protein